MKKKDKTSLELIGYITFIIDNNKNLKILFLIVQQQFQGQGFGKLLMLYLFNFIIRFYSNYFLIKSISLDDCSDLACTRQSIYYKLNFRILSSDNPEIMKVNFLKPSTSKISKNFHFSYEQNGKVSPPIHFNSFIDFYNKLVYDNNKLLEKQSKSKSKFKIKIYHENILIDNNYKIKSIKKIIPQPYSLRERNKSSTLKIIPK